MSFKSLINNLNLIPRQYITQFYAFMLASSFFTFCMKELYLFIYKSKSE